MSSGMIKIGIIGFGYWGPNLARNFLQADNCLVKTIADTDPRRLERAKKLYPFIAVTKNAEDIFNDPEIDGVVIAVPVSLHYELCRQALLKGKHVLIEKPMAHSRRHAQELIDIALKTKKILMVDHTFLYTGAVRKIKEIITTGLLGEVQYFDSVRINLGLFQSDINVVWDLAAHDLAILRFLVEEEPYSVIATGISHTTGAIENIAYITLFFKSKKIAHFNCSWVSPVKIRRILVGGTQRMIVYDDLEPTEKVKLYDYGYVVEKEKAAVDYRIGDISIPNVGVAEGLYGVARDFINCIHDGGEPLSNWKTGLAVVSVLEAADRSLKNRSKEIIL